MLLEEDCIEMSCPLLGVLSLSISTKELLVTYALALFQKNVRATIAFCELPNPTGEFAQGKLITGLCLSQGNGFWLTTVLTLNGSPVAD